VRTSASGASERVRLPLPGEALTGHAVTVITAAIVVMTFAFSLGNVTRLCLDLGITAWVAWLVAPAVDLSVIGLLTGIRFLSLHGYSDDQLAKPRRMLRFCGILTLALNTSGALSHQQFGTALVDGVGPALLIGWSEVGPWLLRQIYAACIPTTDARRLAQPGTGTRRRAPRGDRTAHLPGYPPRAAADRPRPRQRPGRRDPRGGGSRRGSLGSPPQSRTRLFICFFDCIFLNGLVVTTSPVRQALSRPAGGSAG
jgi:hypothetical protein